jgi:isoquinoline 1-oxidoreductase alpha subunit
MQLAWIAQQVPQCGYCQSGMLMVASRMTNNPSDSSISGIGNVCVCGTYQRIRAAIHQGGASTAPSSGGGGSSSGGGGSSHSGSGGSTGKDN